MASSLSTSTSLSPFLLLPLEIRDQIYSYLLLFAARKTPPTVRRDYPDNRGPLPRLQLTQVSYGPSTGRVSVPKRDRSSDSHEPYCRSTVYYESISLAKIVPTLGIISTCRQLRSEIKAFISHKEKTDPANPLFLLDCTVEKNSISPTWLTLPTSLAAVHRLQINLRLLHMLTENFSNRTELVVRPVRIFELLHRLFNHGPHFYFRKHRPTPVCIDTLILNFTDEFRGLTGLIGVSSTTPVSFERVEQVLLGLRKYGLLRGRVRVIRIQFEEYVREIQVEGLVGWQGPATSSEWMAWVFRWKKDPMSHLLDE